MFGMASNAVLSKARAMYGKRLTEKDYTDLLLCKSVSEVASYIKTKTHYSSLLTDINETTIHRGQLETIIRKKSFMDLSALCRYEITVGDDFANYILYRTEIEQIMRYTTLMGAGRSDEYLYEIPDYLEHHTKVNFSLLRRASSFEDILNALEKTKYKKIVEPFKPQNNKPINYAAMENALYASMYSEIFNIINSKTKGTEKKQLSEFFNFLVDYSNFIKIYRLKCINNCSYKDIKDYILPFGSLSNKHLENLCNTESANMCLAYIRKTYLGKSLSKIEYNNLSDSDKKLRYIYCSKNMKFSIYPTVVMLSYIMLLDIEISNIIIITEGVRYQLPSDKIAEMLIIPKTTK